MTERESHYLEHKSLRLVTGANVDFGALAQTCVCFANGAGGTILIGFEDTDPIPAWGSASNPPCWTGSGNASAN
jgi:ATP-dependent DNA helicase RecG